MKIVKIEIDNFRSIKDKVSIRFNDSKMKSFVGPNNIGKSNILRAINLFFNYEVEPNLPLNPKRDFSQGGKDTLTINIIIDFSEKQDRRMKTYLDKYHPGEFKDYIVPITLIYYSTGTYQYTFTIERGKKKNIPSLIERIIETVDCVYIPAIKDYKHIINREMMKKIVIATFHGWGRGGTSKQYGEHKEKFINTLSELQSFLNISGDYMTEYIHKSIPSIERFDFSLPHDNLEDFLGKLLFEVKEDSLSEKIPLDYEGSGIQSYTIYSILKLLYRLRPKTTHRKSSFIWLIGEPETFMHHDLQKQTYKRLQDYADEGHILLSTHSPVFI
ncbi:MAG: ATP-dependent nuclease, partial [Planctomycetota bacterium]